MASVKETPIRRRGLREKLTVILNPLPKITERELFERAGFESKIPALDSTDPFEFRWFYGGGEHREKLFIKAGDSVTLRESEAKEFMLEFKELGGVVFPSDATAAQEKAAVVDGLQRALKFYEERGEKRITEFRKVHGLGKDDLSDYKENDLSSYYLNAEKAKLVKAALLELRQGAPKVPQSQRKN